jgi:hypothetical protein
MSKQSNDRRLAPVPPVVWSPVQPGGQPSGAVRGSAGFNKQGNQDGGKDNGTS